MQMLLGNLYTRWAYVGEWGGGGGGGGGGGEALHLKMVMITLRDQIHKRVGISPADAY